MSKTTPKAQAPKPLVLGLLGGVASGKSTVAKELAQLGAQVLDADRFAREAFGQPEIAKAILAKLGPEVLGGNGSLDRAKVATRVFAEESLRRWLEELIHPPVRARIEAGIEAARLAGKKLVVLDVPLLAEGGLIERCDTTLFVAAPKEQRESRAQRERGWARGEIARREQNQKSLDEKRRLAKHVIENSGSLEELGRKVRLWFDSVLQK